MADTHPNTRSYCPDCGPAGVSHVVERWSVRADTLIGYLEKPPAIIWQKGLKPLVAKARAGRLAPGTARAFAALGLGTIVTRADDKNNWRARVLWQEAERRGIAMREFRPFGLAREIFYATYGDDTRGFDGLPRPRTAHESSLNWMDDKGVILNKFRAAGIPMPRGKSVSTIKDAEKVFHSIDDAVIVKPAIGSRSRHTYIGIIDVEALRHAFKKAKQLSPRVVVEEELHGFVFRITLVGGAVAGIMRREPPHVIGDGIHTIHELVITENNNPLRHGPIFHELQIDEETPTILKEQHLSLDSIADNGRIVIIHPKVSRAYGASTTEMTDIHPDNQKLFLHIAKVLDDPLVGVDFMIEDMAKSWKQQKCGVIECNSLPFIDLHHYPLKGPAKNSAGDVWDLIFARSGTSAGPYGNGAVE
jgi:D-alanine-D-alanine ligase-like ATP-grasp enzyme